MTRTRASVRAVAWARAVAVIVAVIGLDQLSKHLIADPITVGDERRFVPGIIKIVHVRNPGVAFGFLSGGGAIVLAVTLIALVGLGVLLTARPQRRLLWLPTGLLIGGALGNLLDRVTSGAVTDFIKFPHWPAFNLADISITFGVLALLYVLEGTGRRDAG